MVCSVYPIKDAGAAAEYFSQTDDYYREAGHAPTAWAGRGAEALGLHGEVSTAQAKALLEGRLPNGEKVGGDNHRPGYDATFSAPKSVSVATYIHGDARLIAAHDAAVREAIRYLEREAAATRIREGGEVRTEAAGNFVVATFRHDTSREAELQLHTHGVTMNVTQSADGRWRAIESRPIFRLQMEAGAVYRASLARGCEKLGWTIEKTVEGGEPSFELAEISKAERELFSSRSKQIEAELAKIGKTRETTTAKEREIAALNTRQGKQEIDRAELARDWQDKFAEAGFKTLEPPQSRRIPDGEYHKRADAAVKAAVEHLSEREARFIGRQIAAEARKIGMGKIDDRDIEASISRAVGRGALVERETRQFDAITGQKTELAGYTTREAMKIERQMLAFANAAVGAVQPAMTREQADEAIRIQETKPGSYDFNQAQRDATHAVLAGSDRITLIQGYAGTAKTTSVLAASAAAFRAQGYEVVALAPTQSAAKTLGEAIGAKSNTVASFINKKPEASEKPRVYIVDEFSMLSTRDTEKLLVRTQDGRLIGVGDVSQLGSVEAGAAFRQMQADSGLKTQVLDEIVRQRNEELRQAVYDAIRGDAHAALEKVEVRELATREERVQAIARDYTSFSRDDREKTIIIAPGRDDRREINDAVRAELKSRGELGESRQYEVLDRIDMTKQEARQAESYAVEHRLQAGRDYESLGMKKGEYANVVAVGINKNRITIETQGGTRHEIDPSKYTKFQANEPRQIEIAVGDRLANRENTEKMKNGTILHVEKVTDKQVHARDENDKLHKLDMREAHKLDHAYAQTGHESQGRTCDRVMVHGESTRTNLMNQQNAYVAISRAKDSATIYTDSREKLAQQIERETGQKETALKGGERPQPEKQPDRQADKQTEHQPDRQDERQPQPGDRAPSPAGKTPDLRTGEDRRHDGELAARALKTKGQIPQPAKIAKDIEKGKARWEFDSKGERYLSYTNGKTYHKELHGRVREVKLRQAKTLGTTAKTAKIVDKKLEVFGIKTGLKIGEKVVVGRDTAMQKIAGRDRDELRDRMRSKETGGVSKTWAKLQDKVMSKLNTEGWRGASTQESIRAKLSAAIETRSMRSEARDKLEEKVKTGKASTDRDFER